MKTFQSWFYNLQMISMLVLFSCNNESPQQETAKSFYDLKKYFAQQTVFLEQHTVSLQKKIEKDGITEEKKILKVDWQHELAPFIECDINKPSWFHSFFTDTTFAAGEMRVKYLAREKKLPVQMLMISFELNNVKRIQIEKESSNKYFHSKNSLLYEPQKGFSITGMQEVMLSRKTNYTITASILFL